MIRYSHVLIWHNHQETFTGKSIGLQLIIHRLDTGASSKKEQQL